jgi:2-dehydropantoate 2-reductase
VLVTLKTTANHLLEKMVGPLIKDDTVIVTLQNGLGDEELLATLFGAERILGGMAFVCINRIGPGEILHTDHGKIVLGELGRPAGDRTRRIAEIFTSSRVRCEVTDNLLHGRWEKLIWNVPFNGLGALLNLTTDKLIDSEHGLSLVRTLMQEVITIAASVGLSYPNGIAEEKIRYTRTMGSYKTSAQVDREKKRPLELEAIWGEPLKIANKNQITTNYLQMLYESLTLIDYK